MVLGVVLFVIFYWLIPGWFESNFLSNPSSPFTAIVEPIIGRRLRFFRLIGIASALACGFFAIRNYYTEARLDYSGRRTTGFLSRFLAKFLD